ncbi:MAG: YgiT-type zinc finger protein [Bacteroidetes bacterium]|nr:YgiT-type zinc finger protein [Bacteroidota bacterium]MBU1422279.1 YgiT-type zinc finger protein [Bacteroidota bacterium]MBU2470947.1 YgiT-type zinc finger protein [Bacteroidota bacterium]MBU2636925.1 YgiT-type zinc finger protein [Bacteroidota bacterium]
MKIINLIIIENIPLINCTHCGESYFIADTLYEIERIKLHRKSIAKQRKVSVANFA